MKKYKLHGLHCKECSDQLESELNRLPHTSGVAIDYSTNTLTIDETKVDVDEVRKIMTFEKISMESADTSDSSENDASGGHSHGANSLISQESSKKMIIVFFLNLSFSIAGFIFGYMFSSIAIMSDAIHDLGDAFSIGAAAYFEKLSTKEANDQYSFGYQRFSLLGALLTASVLLGGSAVIIFNAVPRLFNAVPVDHEGMLWLAVAAIVINGFSAWLMSRGESHNASLISLHMMEDLLGWIGVLIVSILLYFTDWYFLDPLLSIAIALFIIYKTWPMFKETIQIFLEVTPEEIPLSEVEKTILSVEGVTNLSHLHVWTIDGNEHAMTATLSTNKREADELESIKEQVREELFRYAINHSTIEIVFDPKDLLRKETVDNQVNS